MDLRRLTFLAISAALLVGASAASIDDNGNGMSDTWEAAYGRSLIPSEDADGDGRTNLEESMAGTDPRNPLSVLRTESFSQEADSVSRLRWPTVAGKRYQLQVSFDLTTWSDLGAPVVGTGQTSEVALPLATSYLTGRATNSRWLNMSKNSNLETVRANVTNNVAPTDTGFLTTLEIPQTSPNLDQYGQWVRGWIIPPTTGSYTFYFASDDSGELWLSTTAEPAAAVKIATVSGWTGFREWTKTPEQTSAPVTLTAGKSYYFQVLHKEWTGGDHLSVGWTGPGFPTTTVIAGQYLATSGKSLAQTVTNGLWFRLAVSDADTDGDGVSDADEFLAGSDPTNAMTVPRVADAARLRGMLVASNTVTIGSPEARAYEEGAHKGRFTFFRSGSIDPLTISYTVSGTAVAGTDYSPLSGTVYLGVGQNSVSVDVTPLADALVESAETVIATLTAGPGYSVGSPGQATVTIDDAPDLLYIATLRPDPAVRSGGYGTVGLNVAGNGVFATLSVSLGNLLTPQIATELYVSVTGASGASVLSLPVGQITSTRWEFTPAAGLSGNDLRTALSEGRLYARVTSTGIPGGEIFGKFVTQAGWQTMPIPPTPPALPVEAITDAAAARFLVQATFGPTQADITHLMQVGYSAWLDEQFAAPRTQHLPYVQARRAQLLAASSNQDDGWQGPRQEAWWQAALTAPDQLRQRMAFALSEIFVVSDVGVLDGSHEGITNYYDQLAEYAFGNYRELFEKVTLSPIMGQYLSMVRNQKPNAATGAEPDENYARECMQLFSIGLSQLNLDGSLKLGATGMPNPTYTQSDIIGLAHVYTGWSYKPIPGESVSFLWATRDEMNPMSEFATYHDTTQKVILNHTVVPAGQTMSQDLALALDTIFNHPNVGPFIARQLIQRFVTSNPSPGYIYRVASVFNNNGSGVRGDFKAVIKAILLDYEARSTSLLSDQAHGKQKEPVVRYASLMRAMKATPPKPGDSRFFLDLQYTLTSQAALKSGSVFNFFQPGYVPPGTLSYNGLFAPEFQITSETTIINQDNAQHAAIFWGMWTREKKSPTENYTIYLDVADQAVILKRVGFTAVQNQTAMLDNLSLLLLNGRMSPGLKQKILDSYAALPSWFTSVENDKARVNMALWLITASPEFAIQK